ncbi:tetratricopeptide repeat protein [Roseivirga sp.]|uniref:tetratricopeptide repeat protein n=1 Tax=Roseivirga sp. TaxID=1964215 RepID=UPI003B51ADEB
MDTTNDQSVLEQAKKFQRNGDLVNAEKFYNQALIEDPDSVEAISNLGMLFLMKGDTQNAVNHWHKALEIDKNNLESLTNLGYVYSQVQDFNNSVKYLEKAYSLAPERDDIALQIAQIRAQHGNMEGAMKMLEPFLEDNLLSPNSFLMYSQLQLMQGDFSGSKKTLSRLIERDSNQPEAMINLASILENEGQTEEAEKHLRNAIQRVPFHFQANLEMGRFLSSQGQLTEGIGYLNKAKEIQPEDWGLHVHLGNAFQDSGDFDQAIVSYQKALSINPNDLGTRQNLSRVLSRFVPPWHLKMLADHERNDAFEGALKNMIHEDTVALDIGTGSGLLAMMAARHGAKKVYACEQSKYIAEAAKQNIAKNQLADKIQLFQSKSSQINESQLDPKPNLIVAEIFDSGLLGEHAIPSFRHALENLCSENTRIIPKAAEVKGRLIHAPKAASVNPMKKISGFDVSAFDQFRVPEEYVTQQLSDITHDFCSEEFKILEVDFENLWAPMAPNQCIRFIASIPIEREKPIHGVAFWFTLFMDGQIQLSSAPGRKDNHWGQAISYFNEPISGKAGQKLSLTVNYTDTKIWFEDPKVV